MNGFPNLKWLSVITIYTSSMMSQDGVTHYVDIAKQYGIPDDVCLMPVGKELGLAIDDDFPNW